MINKIKSVSLSLFAQKGYEGTSLANIAQGVGIRKSSIYSHFEGKEHLFLSVFEDVQKEELEAFINFCQDIKDDSAKGKLYSIFKYYGEMYENNNVEVVFWKRNILFPPEFLKEKLQEKIIFYEKTMSEMVTAIFNKGIINGEIQPRNVEDLLGTFICLIDGMFMESHYYTRQHYQVRLEAVWHTFWAGIKNNITE
ncbi:transcriptional regulator, TetR family [Desulforamulus reducens MI-1]|uniref:Transcriptional regulator, TetR family n=1 Tax=Desulforamulus reducens (strain ATCC BAA-1160 / DSM 100696 / MI-1) TaxID=349161 RepID=A4J8W4_DESRM|nr:TetR/AcrR family transcriptional regulator [Desulforamulus reducens]ABO51517.1 transcriptional regulator, TetR family [Desulforamulus reducens MI-1]